MIRLLAPAIALALASPALARADPCLAIPETGPPPAFLAPGKTFSGPVVLVIDGDSFCVAVGPRRGADWVEVRVADFHAAELKSPGGPEARLALQRVAMGKQATCVAGLGTYDRIAARCRIGGRTTADLMRSAGAVEGGNGAGAVRGPTSQSAARPQAPRGLSCPELRARGGARRGEAGYRPEWDGDNDGIACEPYRR